MLLCYRMSGHVSNQRQTIESLPSRGRVFADLFPHLLHKPYRFFITGGDVLRLLDARSAEPLKGAACLKDENFLRCCTERGCIMQTYFNLGLSDDTPIHVPRFHYQEGTMQVPRGRYSILSELWHRNVTSAEALVYLALNHQSYWDTGLTWCIAGRELSRSLGSGMSVRYCRSVLESLEDKAWIMCLPLAQKRRRFKLIHHCCDAGEVPVDDAGKPLKFAVPRGAGGPFERLESGDISWKACLLWIVYKLHSNWNTGITEEYTIGVLAKLCRNQTADDLRSSQGVRGCRNVASVICGEAKVYISVVSDARSSVDQVEKNRSGRCVGYRASRPMGCVGIRITDNTGAIGRRWWSSVERRRGDGRY